MVQKLCAFLVIIFIRMGIGTCVNVAETFKAINDADEKFELSDNPNIILVLGSTGVGKSTLVHYIAGDYSRIFAYENKDEILITDLLDVDYAKNSSKGNPRKKSTTVSRTIIPEMVIDEHENVWYDCPGFDDSRGTTIELVTNYLMKVVIENASQVKIVLVIDHNSVYEDIGDRGNLHRMLGHASKLLKDVQLFHDSVSLVVSKMGSYNNNGLKRNETLEKRKVADFLKTHRESLMDKKPIEQQKIDLIDSILLPTDRSNPKISIFWRPDQAGPFNKIEKMVEGRRKIRKSILEHTNFVNIKGNSFDLALSAKAIVDFQQMEHETIDLIAKTLQNVDNELLNVLQTELKPINEPYKKQKWLSLIDKSFLYPNASEVTTILQWTNNFKVLINTFNITKIDIKNIDQIEQNVDNFGTLKTITESKMELPVRDFIATSSKTKDFLINELEWNSVILQVYEYFSDYKVQKNVKLYNVKNLNDWERPNAVQGLQIYQNNFDKFVHKFQPNKKFESTESRRRELNEIIEETLSSAMRVKCDNETMTIEGNYVKSSDINPQVKCKSKKITKINVYVVATFFVDFDLNLNKLTELNIFAHKWHIRNNSTFYLNGSNGQSHNAQVVITPLKPIQKDQLGESGTNGGNFMGVASEMIDANKLTIELNGGNGGQGKVLYTNVHNVKPVEDLICSSPPAREALGGSQGYYRFVTSGGNADGNFPVFEAKPGQTADSKIKDERKFTRDGILYSVHCTRELELNPKNHSDTGVIPDHRKPPAPINLSSNIIAYKMVLIEKAKSPLFWDKIQETWDLLDNDVAINQKFIVDDFVRESNVIDDQFFKFHSNVELLPLYDSLLKRMLNYERLNTAKMSAFDRQILKLLHMTILIKTNSMRNTQESDLIIQIEIYLNTLMQKIENYNDQSNDPDKIRRILDDGRSCIQNFQSINDLHDLHFGQIESKIDEANEFIKTGIQPTIDELFNEINYQINMATSNQISYQDPSSSVQNPGMTLSQRSKIIKSNLMKRMTIAVANKVLGFLKYIPSMGSAPATLIGYDIGLSQGKSIEDLKLDVDKLQHLLNSDDRQIFDAVHFELNILIKSMNLIRGRNRNRILIANLNKFASIANRIKSMDLYEHNDVHSFLKSFMSFVNGRVNETFIMRGSVSRLFQNAANAVALIASSVKHYHQLSNTKIDRIRRSVGRVIDEYQGNAVKSSVEKYHQPTSIKIDAIRDEVGKVRDQDQETAVNSSVEHYPQLSNIKIDGLRSEVGKVINQDQDTLIKIMAIDNWIHSRLMPLAKFLKEHWKQQPNYSANSLITLNMLKQQIPIDLHLIQKKIDELMENVDGEPKLVECFMEIKKVIHLVLDIFDRIQKSGDRKKLNDLMSGFVKTSHNLSNVIDPQAIEKLSQSMLNFKVSMTLAHYYRSIDDFKQSIFPFAADYSGDYNIPITLPTVRMDSFIKDVGKKIEKLLENIAEMNPNLKQIYGLYTAFFDRTGQRANAPFYKWHQSEVQEKIQRLFVGQTIYLFADIRKADKRNAVKFDQIGIDFQLNDTKSNNEFADILKEFHISLTHMGESNYRCDEKLFTVNSNPTTMEFSFDKKSLGHPVVYNDKYNILRENLPVLSPYTLWGIRLTHGDLNKLQRFSDLIENIYLTGHGRYMTDDAAICDTDLDKYYARKLF